jgi:hypothetical protein
VFRDVPQIFVIRHDLYNLHARQLAGVVSEEQFPEAVGVLGHLRWRSWRAIETVGRGGATKMAIRFGFGQRTSHVMPRRPATSFTAPSTLTRSVCNSAASKTIR